uniref:Metal-binding protein n=1 Tax=Thermodesulfobacterium geofontis TaxID=1295609 RepID=A0A7C4JSD1_9BACT
MLFLQIKLRMRHRAKSSKIKYEHHMIKGLREFLEKELEPLEYVTAIFPGEIKRTKTPSPGTLRVKFQYLTNTGAKLLAYGSGVVQEIFVVTNEPEKLKEKLAKFSI